MMMETLLAVSVTVIAAIMMTRAVFEILALVQVRRAAREAEKLLALVSREVSSISNEFKSLVQSIHEQTERVEDSIETFHDMAAWMKAFQSEVTGIEETLLQIAAVLGGVRRGLEAVTSSMSGKKSNSEKSEQRRNRNE